MGGLRAGAVVVLTLASAGGARADRPVPPAEAMTIAPPPRTISDDFAARAARLGEAIDAQLGALSLDAVEFRIDGRARRAYLGVHGDSSVASFRIDTSIGMRRDAAAIDTRLELAVGGHRVSLVVPIELAPRSYAGERYLEVRVPIIRKPF